MYKTNNHVHTGRAVVVRAAAAAPDALREWSSSLPGDEFCLFLKTGTPFRVACLGACKEEGAGDISWMMRGCLRCLNMDRRSRRGKNKKTQAESALTVEELVPLLPLLGCVRRGQGDAIECRNIESPAANARDA